ncbi:hypothetical protein DERP_011019 [Dermatophagoides pteronyssinus]|uniref:Uncharacterized protein n=1 Tax=Dermatophagoides pteronyssinus TaxID=6956 RepID=A0ABQ8JVF7_DERPT|nr:hypothetical protein DERP_011019 [Dermatophagoides pteronyssinus]
MPYKILITFQRKFYYDACSLRLPSHFLSYQRNSVDYEIEIIIKRQGPGGRPFYLNLMSRIYPVI